MFNTSNILHVFSNEVWHESAAIVGGREALVKLKEAIDKALSEGEATFETMVNDGEGYNVNVMCVEDEEVITVLAVPYTDEIAEQKDGDGKVLWPYEISKNKEWW